MKLILKQYLASLGERDELDAVLPDLLSQLGLNVFSRPGRGTRQDGVDVGAVGALEGDEDKVYLFSIKPGDITRQSWAEDSVQALRPSLVEILDSYIPNRMPPEHRSKDVVICICCGGDIQEQVRPNIRGFTTQHARTGVSFEEWNGDKLAELILNNFLREDLLPKNARTLLRKAIALLDEPETSHGHFAKLMLALSSVDTSKEKDAVTAVRQIVICLWVLYSWCRETGNLESAYLSAELAVLHAWHVTRQFIGKSTKASKSVSAAFETVCSTYQQVCSKYLEKVVLPHASLPHALSSAVRAADRVDINLRMFDVLGRLAIDGLWAYWGVHRADTDADRAELCMQEAKQRANALAEMVRNNPALLLPIKDDQAIDLTLAILLLTVVGDHELNVHAWLNEMLGRAQFSYSIFGDYPSTIRSYVDLLDRKKDEAFRKEFTEASILYPVMAFWAAMYRFDDVFSGIADFKQQKIKHCNFQYWYPDETSEQHIYIDSDMHGMTLSHLPINKTPGEFLDQIFAECDETPAFKNLSAVKVGLWPLLLIASRYHRIPVPMELFKGIRNTESIADEATESQLQPSTG